MAVLRSYSMAPIKHATHHPHKPHVEHAYVQIFIQQCLPAAQQAKAKWKVPVAVLIAQAADESSWGRKAVNNAYFGIKGKAPDGASVKFGTTEVINGKVVKETDEFRAYKDFGEAADDYGRFLNENPRYKTAMLHSNDPIRFIEELKKAGYASEPSYSKIITSIIHTHNLGQYDK